MNTVIGIGNLTKDPALRYNDAGKAICRMSVALSRPGKNEADFVNVVAFDRVAENCGKYLAKGRKIGFQGSLRSGSYKDKDGKTVYTTDVWTHNIEFLTRKEDAAPKEEAEDDIPSGFATTDEDVPF